MISSHRITSPAPVGRHGSIRQKLILLAGLSGVVLAVAVLSICIGTRDVGWGEIISALAGRIDSIGAASVAMRIPRTVLALLAGAALGVAGVIMQGMTRNPLADPGCWASIPAQRLPW